jgi:signal transduction histidine kinase
MLDNDLSELASSLQNKDIAEMTAILEQFAMVREYGITLRNQYGNSLFSRQVSMMARHIDIMPGESEVNSSIMVNINTISGEQTLSDSAGNRLSLSFSSSIQPIDEASTVLLRVLPYVLLISLVLGTAVSLIYAKSITAPVKSISEAVLSMKSLEKYAKCNVKSSDEIGELAGNINELYNRLLSTVNDLQNEIQNVAASDKKKIDFMLTVSHELKTPLTSVKGMIEGMIYNVGVYKDRDEYLVHCRENIDALTALVNEILDASRLELSPSPEDFIDTSIQKLVRNTAATYEMIALSKQVSIDIGIADDVEYSLPAGLFSKALSNIISNAVKYADTGGEVNIYTDKEKLVVENTCNPLSPEEIRRVFEPFYKVDENGGHGLGLYLTERILKVCGLTFEFVAFTIGMRFVIYLE